MVDIKQNAMRNRIEIYLYFNYTYERLVSEIRCNIQLMDYNNSTETFAAANIQSGFLKMVTSASTRHGDIESTPIYIIIHLNKLI